MPKTGRPSSLSPEVHQAVITAVQAGNYLDTAAAFAGVSRDSLHEWARRGARERRRIDRGEPPRLEETPYLEFSDALKRALAQAEVADVAQIAKASTEHWQAAAWMLERKFPQRWGRHATVRVEAELGAGEVVLDRKQVERVIRDPAGRAALDAIAALLEGDAGGDGAIPEPGEVAEDSAPPTPIEPAR